MTATDARPPAARPRHYEWVIAPPHPDTDRMCREARVGRLLAQLALNRGLTDATTLRDFLTPQFKNLLPPEALPNAGIAARRLAQVAASGGRIVIYGDYDVDGVTATAILWHGLRLAGATVEYYIPSRLEEGYGLSAEALEKIAERGPALVITVDCGVTALREARRARELGLELIITDHHEPRAELPDALIVHPTALPEKCPNPHLSGAGVALKIAWALAQEVCRSPRVTDRFRDYLLDATALAAMGLVADVVPLTGENRIIASFGLRQLCHTRNPGLRALIEASGLDGKARYDDYDVGFMLAPRLNAVGRLGHAAAAVELFTTADGPRAAEIAADLDARNRERQTVEREILAEAEANVVERGFDRDGCRAIVLASERWHPGVIGIVAARLVERFGRPTVLIALNNGQGQGSGRSIRHFPLHEALGACGTHLQSHGGHAMAAGLRIETERVEAFTSAFQELAGSRLTAADLLPRLRLDDEVSLAEIVPEVLAPLEKLAPYGIGNARPLLATRTVELAEEPRTMGNGAHLSFTVRESAENGNGAAAHYRRAVAFRAGPRAHELMGRSRIRLAFEPIVSRWNGQVKAELKVVDWKIEDGAR